ncbi:unnamed protein product [Symbiodinium sp. KB8]|nr:unnamed protein product [Symbiodinium sp. KB8]
MAHRERERDRERRGAETYHDVTEHKQAETTEGESSQQSAALQGELPQPEEGADYSEAHRARMVCRGSAVPDEDTPPDWGDEQTDDDPPHDNNWSDRYFRSSFALDGQLPLATQTTVQMACDSAEHLDTWLEALRCVQTGGTNARRGAQDTLVDVRSGLENRVGVDPTRLFDLFADGPSPRGTDARSPTAESKSLSFSVVGAEDPAASTDRLRRRLMFSVGAVSSSDQEAKEAEPATVEVIQIDSDCEEQEYDEVCGMPWVGSFCQLSGATEALDPPDALSQLRHLEVEMTGVVEKWSRTLAATEADCRGLLRFFGLGVPEESQLAEAAAQLLRALCTFKSQVGDAWSELEQHAIEEARKRGPRKSAKPARLRARTQTTATDTSEVNVTVTRSESNETLDSAARLEGCIQEFTEKRDSFEVQMAGTAATGDSPAQEEGFDVDAGFNELMAWTPPPRSQARGKKKKKVRAPRVTPVGLLARIAASSSKCA